MHNFSVSSKLYMNQPWSTILPTQSACVGSEIDTRSLQLRMSDLCLQLGLRASRARSDLKGGRCDMNIKWPASLSFVVKTRLRSSMVSSHVFAMKCSSLIVLRHYQDAYSTVTNMFGSTAILPPRTKRWAEAKVLTDCINIKVCEAIILFVLRTLHMSLGKICKLFLYNNEHALALSQHNIHMRKFGDFSRGWGIGEETFEFWSWIARQQVDALPCLLHPFLTLAFVFCVRSS